MAALAQATAKFTGFSVFGTFFERFCDTAEKLNVPHWTEYLNEK